LELMFYFLHFCRDFSFSSLPKNRFCNTATFRRTNEKMARASIFHRAFFFFSLLRRSASWISRQRQIPLLLVMKFAAQPCFVGARNSRSSTF